MAKKLSISIVRPDSKLESEYSFLRVISSEALNRPLNKELVKTVGRLQTELGASFYPNSIATREEQLSARASVLNTEFSWTPFRSLNVQEPESQDE